MAPSSTLEAEVVRLSDAIAYINHDVDDAVRARLIDNSDLPAKAIDTLGATRSARIDTVVRDIITTSYGQPHVVMSHETLTQLDLLREFLFLNVYRNPVVTVEAERARRMVAMLYRYLCEHVEQLPEEFQHDVRGEGMERIVADYIAGMTDAFAIDLFQKNFVPRTWPLS